MENDSGVILMSQELIIRLKEYDSIVLMDTNTLIDNPAAYLDFPHKAVGISQGVITEFNKLKNLPDTSTSVRQAVTSLLQFTNEYEERLSEGIPLPNGSLLFFTAAPQDWYKQETALFLDHSIDHQFIWLSGRIREITGKDVDFISNDKDLRLSARIHNQRARPYGIVHVPRAGVYKGFTQNILDPAELESFLDTKEIYLSKDLCPNESVLLGYANGTGLPVVGIARGNEGRVEVVDLSVANQVQSVTPLNLEQRVFLSACLDSRIQIALSAGKVGSGKTLLSVAAAIELVMRGYYDQIVVIRGLYKNGPETGFLKGDLGQKLDPYKAPIRANLALVLFAGLFKQLKTTKSQNEREKIRKKIEEDVLMWEKRFFEYCSPEYLQGVTLRRTIVLVEEAGALPVNELRLILGRLSDDCKAIVTGDPTQNGNSRTTETTCAISVARENMKRYPEVSYIYLPTIVRSRIAQIADESLSPTFICS